MAVLGINQGVPEKEPAAEAAGIRREE